MRRLDLTRSVGEQPRRPELVGQLAALRLKLAGETAVEDDDPFGEAGGECTGGAHGNQLSWDWTREEISSR